jgi:hypothetical protein
MVPFADDSKMASVQAFLMHFTKRRVGVVHVTLHKTALSVYNPRSCCIPPVLHDCRGIPVLGHVSSKMFCNTLHEPALCACISCTT